jgi:hypothetical protein
MRGPTRRVSMNARIAGRWQRFRQLPSSEQRLLLEALPFHWAARVSLWLIPFRKLASFVRNLDNGRRTDPETMPADVVAWAVAATSALTPGATCLTRSLALQGMLRRRGRPAVLRIGVAKPSGEPFEAHAWVEMEGRTYLGGPELDRFAPMPEPTQWP